MAAPLTRGGGGTAAEGWLYSRYVPLGWEPAIRGSALPAQQFNFSCFHGCHFSLDVLTASPDGLGLPLSPSPSPSPSPSRSADALLPHEASAGATAKPHAVLRAQWPLAVSVLRVITRLRCSYSCKGWSQSRCLLHRIPSRLSQLDNSFLYPCRLALIL